MPSRRLRCLSAVLALALLAPAARVKAAGEIILDTASCWRSHLVWRPPVFHADGGRPASVGPLKGGCACEKELLRVETPAPPAAWREPDFDDSAWSRLPAQAAVGAGDGGLRAIDGKVRYSGRNTVYNTGWMGEYLARICLRGRFTVADPARAVGLTLSVAYRGGVVVHLNGREVKRAHLPGGELGPDALAESYPLAVHELDSDSRRTRDVNDGGRVRRLENLALPAGLLRRGVNVLAVEVRRAALHEKCLASPKRMEGTCCWPTAGVASVQLRGPGGPGAAVPNVARPKGVQVWNADVMLSVLDVDWGDPNEPLRPVRLVAARGGACSGQVVVSSTEALRGVEAKATELAHAEGRGKIPLSSIRVRYALPGGPVYFAGNRHRRLSGREIRRLDVLAEKPPAEVAVARKTVGRGDAPEPVFGAVLPVWVTVEVPRGAAPGPYRGTLSVWAGGKAFEVPVELEVCAWRLPERPQRLVHANLYPSPDGVAAQYKVPLWSDRHFELMARSLALIGGAGGRAVFVPLVARTNLGHEETMVRWIKRSSGYAHDFTVMDRYLDLVEKHMGRPRVVIVQAWAVSNGRGQGAGGPRGQGQGPKVSLLDPATKKVTEMEGPPNGTPEAQAFWRPVLLGVAERLKRRGWADAMVLGRGSDVNMDKATATMFKRILPDCRWAATAHQPYKPTVATDAGPIPVWYLEYVFVRGAVWRRLPHDPECGRARPEAGRAQGALVSAPDRVAPARTGRAAGGMGRELQAAVGAPDRASSAGDANAGPGSRGKVRAPGPAGLPAEAGREWVFYPRNELREPHSLARHRLLCETALAMGLRGFGRVGADFWPALGYQSQRARGWEAPIRYPEASMGRLNMWYSAILEPGPDGALSTVRLEMLREGVQECEARAFIEKALAGGRLGGELAKRAQAVLDERTRLLRLIGMVTYGTEMWYHGSGWQERSARLYDIAAEVAEAVGGG